MLGWSPKFIIVFCSSILWCDWKKKVCRFWNLWCAPFQAFVFFLRWIGIFLQACSFTVLVGFIFVIFL